MRRNVLEDLVDGQQFALPARRLADKRSRGVGPSLERDEASPYVEGHTLSWLKVKGPHYREGGGLETEEIVVL